MRRLLTLALLTIFSFQYSTAQETGSPVQFSFSAHRINDSVVHILINGKLQKGFQLFSTVKKNADDAFVSSVEVDSNSHVVSVKTIEEKNTIQSKTDSTAGVEYIYAVDSIHWLLPVIINAKDSIQLKGKLSWLGKLNDEYPSGESTFRVLVEPNTPGAQNVSGDADEDSEKKGFGWIFLTCFIAGLLAVITPCVFPLVPVTVSFFLKKSSTRAKGISNALWYAFSIILIYTIPTIILTLVFGDAVLYKISTHPVSNLLFFGIFLIFAISFFGAFELTLPSSWANKADQQAGKGGLIGIFFMALTLVIVSFSCTGPIVGTLLGQTSNQGISIAPIIGMFAFSLGLALPFAVFALFPSMLQSLPKSGGWLNSVKVVFGFIELALALKFLSNVDLIYHWGILDRDTFLILWIVITVLLGFYILGKLKFSHDSDLPFITIPRLFFAIAAFSFALYLVPGLWGAPLKALSGFIPPITTQDFNLSNPISYTIPNSNSSGQNSNVLPPNKLTEKLKAPFGIQAYFDLEEGLAAAKAANKPAMLDFTGHSCANCRKMEEYVWSDPEVLNRIKNDFILISLYVDESTELPISEQYTNAKGELITTVGEKNLDYERTKFGFGAQPLYMFLDLKGETLSNVKYGYDSDKQKFIDHLEKVKVEFQKRSK
jgi:thiol:disulfide interchange protein